MFRHRRTSGPPPRAPQLRLDAVLCDESAAIVLESHVENRKNHQHATKIASRPRVLKLGATVS